MIKLIIIFFFFQVFLSHISASSHAETLSLQQALIQAELNSPRLKKAESVYTESVWKKKETLSGFLPTLGLQAVHLLDQKDVTTDFQLPGARSPISIPQIIPSSNFILSAQLPLYDGLANVHRYKAAHSFSVAAKDDLEWARFQLERDVTLQFYKAIAAQELMQVAEQNLAMMKDHLKDVNLFKKAGISTNYDILRVEVQVSEANSELLNAIDNSYVTKGKLAELIGLERGSENIAELEGKMPALESFDIQNQNQQKEDGRRDIEAGVERLEGAQQLYAAGSAYWIPKIAFFTQYQYYNNQNNNFVDRDYYRSAYQFGISLTWNIFDGMTSIARSFQSFEQAYQNRQNVELSRLKAKQDVDFWKRKFLYYGSVQKSRRNDIIKSKESVRLAREGIKVGTRTSTDLLDAEAELYRAQAGLINAKLGSVEALINLELATGRLFL